MISKSKISTIVNIGTRALIIYIICVGAYNRLVSDLGSIESLEGTVLVVGMLLVGLGLNVCDRLDIIYTNLKNNSAKK
jgi:hypothetical protein